MLFCTGDLSIFNGVQDVELPVLMHVSGQFNIVFQHNDEGEKLQSLSVGNLGFIGGDLTAATDSGTSREFQSIEFPNLTKVGGGLSLGIQKFGSWFGLANVAFPLLSSICGGLVVAHGSGLDRLEFPSLETVGVSQCFEYGG